MGRKRNRVHGDVRDDCHLVAPGCCAISAVAGRLGISWDEAWGLERRELQPIEELGVDETSFQKRHEYVTALVNRSDGTVIDILDDRKKATLKAW